MVSTSDTFDKNSPPEGGPLPQQEEMHKDAAETSRSNPFIVPLFSSKTEGLSEEGTASDSDDSTSKETGSARNDISEPEDLAAFDSSENELPKTESVSEKTEATAEEKNQIHHTDAALPPEQAFTTDETVPPIIPASVEEETPIYALSSRSYKIMDHATAENAEDMLQKENSTLPVSEKLSSTPRRSYSREKPLLVDSSGNSEASEEEPASATVSSTAQRVIPSRKNPESNKSAIINIKIGSTADDYAQDSPDPTQRFSFKKLFSKKPHRKRKYFSPAQKKLPSAKPPHTPAESADRTNVFPQLKVSPEKSGDNAVPETPHKVPKIKQTHKKSNAQPRTGKRSEALTADKNADPLKINKPEAPPAQKKDLPPSVSSAPITPGKFSKFIQFFRQHKNYFQKKEGSKPPPPITEPKLTQNSLTAEKKPGVTTPDTPAPSEKITSETPKSPAAETITTEEPTVRRSRRDIRQKTAPPKPKKERDAVPTTTILPEIKLPEEIEKPPLEVEQTKRARKKQLRLAKAQLPSPAQQSLPQLLTRTINITLKSLTVITVATLLAATVLIVFYFNTINAANSSGEKNRTDIYNTNLTLIGAVDTLKPELKSQYHSLLDSIKSDLEEHNKLLEKTNATTQEQSLTLNNVSDFAAELNANAQRAYTSALGASTDLSGLFASISLSQYFKAQDLVHTELVDSTALSWTFPENDVALDSDSHSCKSITGIAQASRKDSVLYNTSRLEQYTVYLLEVEAARQSSTAPEAKETMVLHQKQQQYLNYYLNTDCIETPLQEAAFSLPTDFGTNPQHTILEQTNNLLGSYTYLVSTTAATTPASQTPQVRAFAVNSMFSAAQHAVKLGAELEATPGLKL